MQSAPARSIHGLPEYLDEHLINYNYSDHFILECSCLWDKLLTNLTILNNCLLFNIIPNQKC